MKIALCVFSILISIIALIINFGNVESMSFISIIVGAITIIKSELVQIRQEKEYAIDPLALSNFEISKRYKNFSFPKFDAKGNSRLKIIECELENTEDTQFGTYDKDIFRELEIGDRLILSIDNKFKNKGNVYAISPSQIFVGWIPQDISTLIYDRLRNNQTVFAHIKYIDTFNRQCIIEIARYSQKTLQI